jgi:hypothetical protein
MCISEIKENLEKIAYEKTIPFCYSCYKEAPSGTCKTCHSDDLMRLLPDFGCEFGIDWVIPIILEENCKPLYHSDLEERFLDMLNECYEKVTIGGYEWDYGEAFKRLDEIAFDQEVSAYIDSEIEETIFTFDT